MERVLPYPLSNSDMICINGVYFTKWRSISQCTYLYVAHVI